MMAGHMRASSQHLSRESFQEYFSLFMAIFEASPAIREILEISPKASPNSGQNGEI